ncbi:phosphoribosylformylglycinamidine synthase subunit PurQ [Periweissella beninensis]|uniref:phosphoribosylformylglycinamidine synthase subunit PurQ n=1 Tax=Periweissella beninensis TaxID=504936 RepID=UPI0021A6D81A|nr:phosphoribosylformylglycinamidine synthase subunit PurQ [Periweissella beninensis]MCT4395536.1 phosphoribosylformylglycinamidine synthase subunit PurQ [Periweissella beninensis]
MKAAVISFPGSNCDYDMYYALKNWQITPTIVPASATDLTAYDVIFLPGGFSYGDYLRTGAIAQFSPIMQALQTANAAGKLIIGICNGFQILTEAGLLPGTLQTNQNPGFICTTTALHIVNSTSAFSSAYQKTDINLPIAHGEGNYYIDDEQLSQLKANNQIIFTYNDNPNGSVANIAGVTNVAGNVFGMMPHPERAVETILNNTDGQAFFTSIINFLNQKTEAVKA